MTETEILARLQELSTELNWLHNPDWQYNIANMLQMLTGESEAYTKFQEMRFGMSRGGDITNIDADVWLKGYIQGYKEAKGL